MPTVLLIRHGENPYTARKSLAGRRPNAHLNDKGRAQATALAKALSQLPIKAVYSSPLERAVETARPIAEAHGLRVQKRAGLIETNLGRWEGKSIKILQHDKAWKTLQEHPSRFQFPGGEWMVEQQARLVTEIEKICSEYKKKDWLACVGHADPFKLVIAYYIGLPLDAFQRLTLNTASVTLLSISERGARLLRLNWTVNNL